MDQRKVKGEETKAKILNAALDIISENGISSLSTKRIADRAGISKSNVFHHFPNVELILEAFINKLCEKSSEAFTGVRFDNLESLFLAFGRQMFDLDSEAQKYYKVLYAFYFEKLDNVNIKATLANQKSEVLKGIKSSILSVGEIEISEELAKMLQMDIDGMMTNYLFDNESEKYLKIWKIKSEMYIKAIREQANN